jgi:hypothetical protein
MPFGANLFSRRVLLLAFLRIFAMRKHKAPELISFKWMKREFYSPRTQITPLIYFPNGIKWAAAAF